MPKRSPLEKGEQPQSWKVWYEIGSGGSSPAEGEGPIAGSRGHLSNNTEELKAKCLSVLGRDVLDHNIDELFPELAEDAAARDEVQDWISRLRTRTLTDSWGLWVRDQPTSGRPPKPKRWWSAEGICRCLGFPKSMLGRIVPVLETLVRESRVMSLGNPTVYALPGTPAPAPEAPKAREQVKTANENAPTPPPNAPAWWLDRVEIDMQRYLKDHPSIAKMPGTTRRTWLRAAGFFAKGRRWYAEAGRYPAYRRAAQ
jgi:hypothetical protein